MHLRILNELQHINPISFTFKFVDLFQNHYCNPEVSNVLYINKNIYGLLYCGNQYDSSYQFLSLSKIKHEASFMIGNNKMSWFRKLFWGYE